MNLATQKNIKCNMKNQSITFIFPYIPESPAGGVKVVLEYANRLVKDGWDVFVCYKNVRPMFRKNLFNLIKAYYVYLCGRIYKRYPSASSWFKIDKRVHEVYVENLSYEYQPKTTFYVATAIRTTSVVLSYPVRNNHKLYLIQGYENWEKGFDDKKVRESYHQGLTNLVISRWLQQIMDDEGVPSVYLPNGFDFNYFKLTIPIKDRNKFSIAMAYSPQAIKSCDTGIAAISAVKKIYPQLIACMYGIVPRPKHLPKWIEYIQKPNQQQHNLIYNSAAIFVATSINEGFGLTVGEAMICGAAIACTHNKGYMEMITNGETGLISPTKDSSYLASNIIHLIADDNLRIQLAESGNKYIKKYTWESSYNRLKELLDLTL